MNNHKIIKLNIELLHVALESCLDKIVKYQKIMEILNDKIFYNLFQILITNSGELLSCTINICFLLFTSQREYFRFQFEYFIIILINIASSNKELNTKRELVLDCLSQILSIPRILSELFINYDCNLYHENIVELLMQKLKYIIENSKKSSILREFATDNLLLLIDSLLFETIDNKNDNTKQKMLLIKQKCTKSKLQSCCEGFNEKSSIGVKLFEQNNFIKSKEDIDYSKSLGTLLYRTDKLDKKILGEYLGKRENEKILNEFLKNIKFEELNIEDALRKMLRYFRLPGESPTISLILDQFSEIYLKYHNDIFANHDAVFTLAYAIIMLNVDQHNENAKQTNSMNCSQFIKNVKGINNGQDFSVEMLTRIYNSIHQNEIILPQDCIGNEKEQYYWSRLIERKLFFKQCSIESYIKEYLICHLSFSFEIFQIIWKSICHCLSLSILEKPEKSRLIALINAFSKCIKIASESGMIDIVDYMIIKLIEFSNLLNTNFTIEDVVMSLGFNSITRMTCQVVFRAVYSSGDFFRESWKIIVHILLVLFKSKLLPSEITNSFDFLSPTRLIYFTQPYLPNDNKDDSIFSSIYQLLITNDNIKPHNFDEAYNNAIDIVKNFHLEKFMMNGNKLHIESLNQKLRAILECFDELPDYELKSKAFLIEMITRNILANSHRFSFFSNFVKNSFYKILTNTTFLSNLDFNVNHLLDLPHEKLIDLRENYLFLVERCVVLIFRMHIVLTRQLPIKNSLNNYLNQFNTNKMTLDNVNENADSAFDNVDDNTYNNKNMNENMNLNNNCSEVYIKLENQESNMVSLKINEQLSSYECCYECISSLIRSMVLIDYNLLIFLGNQISCGIFEHIVCNSYKINSSKDWVALMTLLEIVGAGNTVLTKAAMYSAPIVITVADDSRSPYNWTERDAFNKNNNDKWEIIKNMWQMYNTVEDDVILNQNEIKKEQETNLSRLKLLNDTSNTFYPFSIYAFVKSINTLSFLTKKIEQTESAESLISKCHYLTPFNFIPIVHCLLAFAQASYNLNQNISVFIEKPNKSKQNDLIKKQIKENELKLLTTIENSTLDLLNCVSSVVEIFLAYHDETDYFYLKSDNDNISKLEYCIPLLKIFAFYCIDHRESLRNCAYDSIYSLLFINHFKSASGEKWQLCFSEILIPLLTCLKNYDTNQFQYILTIRLKIMTMIGKIFLQQLHSIHMLPNFEPLWLNLLQLLIDIINDSKECEIILEAIPEMIKNILLVMFTLNLFIIEETSDEMNDIDERKFLFFQQTNDRVSKYLPFLKNSLLLLIDQNTQNIQNENVEANYIKEKENVECDYNFNLDNEDSKSNCNLETNVENTIS